MKETRPYLFPQTPSSYDAKSKSASSSGGSSQDGVTPLTSASDLSSTLALLGVELDSGVSDPETALWGGMAKASLALAWNEYTAGKKVPLYNG